MYILFWTTHKQNC